MASVARLKVGKPRTGRVIGDKFVGRAMRIYLPLLALLRVTLFPFYWMAVTSFKSASELFDFSVSPLWVREPTLEWYQHLFTQTNFPHWAFNTAVVATISTLISLFCSILAGYSLARLRYRGADSIGWGIFVTYLVPPTLLFLPLTFVIRELHLFNNLWALILTYPTFLIPFCTWMLMGFFKGMPAGAVKGQLRGRVGFFRGVSPLRTRPQEVLGRNAGRGWPQPCDSGHRIHGPGRALRLGEAARLAHAGGPRGGHRRSDQD